MSIYKFDDMKRKAHQQIDKRYTNPYLMGEFPTLEIKAAALVDILMAGVDLPFPKRIVERSDELLQALHDRVDGWDIRKVKGLIKAFPCLVASKYRNQNPVCYMDEAGDWVVCYEKT